MPRAAKSSKDKLITDLQAIIEDAEELLELTADQTGDKLGALRDRISGRLLTAKDRIADAEAALIDSSKKAARATDDYVHEHPWQSLGVAAGVAFLLGLLASRR